MIFALLLLIPLVLSACATSSPGPPVAVRLVDLFEPAAVEGTATAGPARPRTEWTFDDDAGAATTVSDASAPPRAGGPHARHADSGTGPPRPGRAAERPASRRDATRGWDAGPGVAGLAIRGGRLAGASTIDFPVVHVERTSGLDDPDLLHAIEIRMRVSAGTRLGVSTSGSESVDLAEAVARARVMPWRATTPIVAGETMRTYVVRGPRPTRSSEIRHLLIRPTDASGARFEIESVRLVFRKEHLARIASGIGWQGLSEIYQESLVARSPESIRLLVTLPERPWLDLSIGTIEDGPVTFRVDVSAPGTPASRGSGGALLERTITTPHRWERVPVDLGAFAGRKVDLSLTITAGKEGTLGFWGSPVVRSRGAAPARARTPVAARRAAGAEAPQGVIVIWADTLRRDHLDVYGYGRETAPNVRRMAGEGVRFDHCVVQASWTKVSTPSLMTSLYPTSHGVHDFSDRLPASATTLAEIYRDAGYATLSMSSILFTGQFSNLHQGFEEVHEDGSLPDPESSKTARIYVDRLLPWLEAHRDVPFFVFLHVADPHDPYRPHPPYDTLWGDPATAGEHERQAKAVRASISDPLLKMFGMPTRAELEKAGFDPDAYVAHDRDWYDGSIRGMDAEIGRLLERLRALGLEERTLVAFTGDHGEEFLEHGRMFHGQSTYGELANAALILRRPGALPAGAVVDATVETIDVMPTLLEMSGLEEPGGIQGRSLMPLIAAAGARGSPTGRAAARFGGGGAEAMGPRERAGSPRSDRLPSGAEAFAGEEAPPGDVWEERPAITEKIPTPEPVGAPPPRDVAATAITLGGWKLIHNTRRAEGKPEYELYEAIGDPLNARDVAAEHPEIVERLARELTAWRERSEAARLKPDAEAAKNLSGEELERLRSLGYIQ